MYKILNITYFTPFWVETITILMLVATGIIISCFIKKNIKSSGIGTCLVFTCMYISYSLYNEPLIYQASNLAVFCGNLLTIFSVITIFEIYANKVKYKYYFPLVIIMAIAISMYEACCQTFLVAILIMMLIKLIIKKENDKQVYTFFGIGITILLFSIILNYLILHLFYFIGVPNELSGGRNINWFDYGFFKGVKNVIRLGYYLVIRNTEYFPVLEFAISVVLGILMSIYYAFKEKNINIFNIGIILIVSNFALSILQCKELLYRTTLSWGVYVASIATLIYVVLSRKKYFKTIGVILVVLIILWQTKDLNQWFCSEYIKYQRDLKDAYQIAEDIKKEVDDLKKPVVFVGLPEETVITLGQEGSQANGLSAIWWGVDAFSDCSYELIKFINLLGYDYVKPTKEQYLNGIELSEEMSCYPKDGYIAEFQDIIVVKFDQLNKKVKI